MIIDLDHIACGCIRKRRGAIGRKDDTIVHPNADHDRHEPSFITVPAPKRSVRALWAGCYSRSNMAGPPWKCRPATVIAIVIFGAAVGPDGKPSTTLRRRVEAAARFGSGLSEPLYVPTGAVGRHGPSEASIMADLLRGLGVPAERIALEETGTDTLTSALAVARLLRARAHAGPVYAASSAYHLPRCVLLLRLAGLRARRCPPPGAPAASGILKRWYWRLREIPALPWDAGLVLLTRLRSRI